MKKISGITMYPGFLDETTDVFVQHLKDIEIDVENVKYNQNKLLTHFRQCANFLVLRFVPD